MKGGLAKLLTSMRLAERTQRHLPRDGATRPRALLWDGGVGTGLRNRGLDLRAAPPEAWLLQRPEAVRALHAEFARAGADVLQTNTFGLLRLGWPGPRQSPLPAELPVLVEAAVRLCREGAAAALEAPPEVIACLGPSGLREDQLDDAPGGRSPAALLEERAELLAALFAAQGVQALHLETWYQPWELIAVARGVRAGAPLLSLFCSLTLNPGHSGLETPSGTSLASMLRVLEQVSPDLIGVNCSQQARRMIPSVTALRAWAGARVPVLAQPQVGAFGADCRGGAKEETPAKYTTDALRLLGAGASAVGGCCGCTGEHLAALRGALDGAAASEVPGGSDNRGADAAPAIVNRGADAAPNPEGP